MAHNSLVTAQKSCAWTWDLDSGLSIMLWKRVVCEDEDCDKEVSLMADEGTFY